MDKSGCFFVLTRQQYLKAGLEHTKNDRKITLEDQEEIQRCLNGHMCWWAPLWNLGDNWGQEARCLSNLLNLVGEGHKTWSVVPPTRSVMLAMRVEMLV